jgi:hypothetical protein
MRMVGAPVEFGLGVVELVGEGGDVGDEAAPVGLVAGERAEARVVGLAARGGW